MEKERENQKPNVSPNGEEDSSNYEAPEITKHEVLRDLTANTSPGEPSGD